jgi:hypothetical protein
LEPITRIIGSNQKSFEVRQAVSCSNTAPNAHLKGKQPITRAIPVLSKSTLHQPLSHKDPVLDWPFRFQLEVLAEVEPVSLAVSREEIDFRFSLGDSDACLSEQLSVHNPNNHTAEFQWESSNPAFEVTPTRGSIEKQGSVPVTVTWRPGTGSNDGFLTLSVVGGAGASKRVRCSGTYRGRSSVCVETLEAGRWKLLLRSWCGYTPFGWKILALERFERPRLCFLSFGFLSIRQRRSEKKIEDVCALDSQRCKC